jgi:hypothetical protein
MTIQQARKIVHAPEAFSKKLVQESVAFIENCVEADDEDRFWAEAASDIRPSRKLGA